MQLSVMIMNSSLQIMHTHWQKKAEKIKIGLNRQLFLYIVELFPFIDFSPPVGFSLLLFHLQNSESMKSLVGWGEENLKEKIM